MLIEEQQEQVAERVENNTISSLVIEQETQVSPRNNIFNIIVDGLNEIFDNDDDNTDTDPGRQTASTSPTPCVQCPLGR